MIHDCCQGEQIRTNFADSGRVQTPSGTKLLVGIIKKQTELLATSDGKDTQKREEWTPRKQKLSGESRTLVVELVTVAFDREIRIP